MKVGLLLLWTLLVKIKQDWLCGIVVINVVPFGQSWYFVSSLSAMHDGENAMTRYYKCDDTMVKTRWYDIETWRHDGEKAMVPWWKLDIISRFHHRSIDFFIIVSSCFHHRSSCQYHRVFIIIPSCIAGKNEIKRNHDCLDGTHYSTVVN
jgi:hypothetical protein